MAVAGYSEQEKICQDQGEISHRRCVTLQRAAGQQLHKQAAVRLQDITLLLFRLRGNDARMNNYFGWVFAIIAVTSHHS